MMLFSFKVHVTSSSKTTDHCIQFVLSDPKGSALQQKCDLTHNEFCQSCEQLKSIIHEVGEQIKQLSNDDDDLLYVYSQVVQGVEIWKSHLLRSAQQDKARTDVIQMVDETSVLITQYWAMKFLPQMFREHQRDWFGKRGISWHISVVV